MSLAVVLNKPVPPSKWNRYVSRALQRLVDGNIYDISSAAMALKTPFKSGTSFYYSEPEDTADATLAADTYIYAVAPVFPITYQNGVQGFIEGLMTEVSVDVVGPNNSVDLSWFPVADAVSYNLYRTTTNSWVSSFIQNLTGTSFLDIGYVTSIGFPQTFQTKLDGVVTPAGSYLVTLNHVDYQGNVVPVTSLTSNLDGSFQFDISPPRGTNGYFVTVSNVYSATIYVNAYNIQLVFETICQELFNITQEMINQDRANSHLGPTADLFTGNLRYPDQEAVLEVWAELTDAFQFAGYTTEEFANEVKEVLSAYRSATTYQSILDIFENFQNTYDQNKIVFYGAAGGVGSRCFQLGSGFKFYVTRTSGNPPSLNYTWNGGNLWYGLQRGYLESGSGTLASTTGAGYAYFAAYIDGTRNGAGFFNLKILQATFGAPPGDISDPVFAALPINSKVLAVFVVNVATQDIINIAGQGRLARPGFPYSGLGSGPYWCGPTFITGSARLHSAKYSGSRALIYFQDVIGPNPGTGFYTDSQYQEKLGMLMKIIKTIKSQGTVWAFGAAGRPSQLYLEDGNGNLELDGSGNPYLPDPFLTTYQQI
jgi:hypothetical protein